MAAGGGEHSCDEGPCVRMQSFQRKNIATWFGNITEKEKGEVQTVANYYANTTVNLATALFVENVQSEVAGKAGVRTTSGDSVECGVLVWSAADGAEAYQWMESQSGGRDGFPVCR